MELYDRLKEYTSSDFYPWHMPGHKRRLVEFENPFSMDITEIDGFDDLHHPEGILKEAMKEAAEVYGSEKTYFLVNGSSCGILAAVSAAVKPGGKLLMARNCHKSAYHGALLQQAEVTYLYPELEKEGFYGAVQAKDVKSALEKDPEICAVMVVSPGYEGIVSDIEAIAQAAHACGCALIVDEAHGAHFPFAGRYEFPVSALEKGADIVIQSLHKTLPSLTQTALLHLGKGSSVYVNPEAIEFYLRIYQSSSPSYILMASIDHCIHLMSSDRGKHLMAEYARNLSAVRGKLKEQLQILQLYEPEQSPEPIPEQPPELMPEQPLELMPEQSPEPMPEQNAARVETSRQRSRRKECFYDPSKFVIVVPENRLIRIRQKGESGKNLNTQIDGSYLAEILRHQYHLEPEMNTDRYVILMSSPADTKEGFSRMINALLEIDQMLRNREIVCNEKRSADREQAQASGEEKDRHDALWAKLPCKAPESIMKSAYASAAEGKWLPLSQSEGRICHDFIYIYPPGIPLLVPGERISKAELEVIRTYQNHGLEVHGIKEEHNINIVIQEEHNIDIVIQKET